MPIRSKQIPFLLLFGLIFLNLGTIVSKAQESAENSNDKNDPVKKSVSEIIRAKKGNALFLLLTPEDVRGLTAEVQTLDPCTMATPIAIGEVHYGNLTPLDCRLPDNSFADFYSFNGTQGQQVPIFLSSTAFDTYLGITNSSETYTVEDDDSGAGTDSYILATLPETGVYYILANSAFANQFGEYTLSLSPTPYCAYSINPTSAEVSPAGGTYSFAVNTQIGCPWQAYTPPSYFITAGTIGNGPGLATYSIGPNGATSRSGTITLVPGYSPVPAPNLTFTVNQGPLICSYSISSSGIQISGLEYLGTFDVMAPAGCFWQAQSNSWFISTNSEGRGNGTVTYLVANNNGADHVGMVTVAGRTFTVTQSGFNCTYTVSPTSITIDRLRQSGSISVTTQPNCTWSMFRASWVYISYAGRGSGSAIFNAFENMNPFNRSEVISFSVEGAAGSRTIQVTQTSTIIRRSKFDFDGDGKTDISVFRPSSGEWWLNQSSSTQTYAAQFGNSSDKMTPADFTGDGRADVAFWRPSTGEWFILRSDDGSFFSFPFGASGDIPAPADYDGDGKADPAVFRPATGTWYISRSSGGTTIAGFGNVGDIPAIADYDGDGKTDIAIYRPSVGEWWYQRTTDGQVFAAQFGQSTDKPVPGDFTGDGRADLAFFRPGSGEWFVLRSESVNTYFSFPFGVAGDVPVAGDYDGDGKMDAGVFRPSTNTWYVSRTTAGVMINSFGSTGDLAVPASFVP